MPTEIKDQPQYVKALIYDGIPKWTDKDANGTTVVTYSFMTQVPDYYDKGATERTNFVAFDSTQEQAARNAIQLWERVANITFKSVSDDKDGGEIRFGTAAIKVPDTDKDDKPILDKDGKPVLVVKESAHASPPGDKIGGDLWLNNAFSNYANPTPGSFDFYTLLHELGHALGLSHPGPYNAGSKEKDDAYKEPNNYLKKEEDNWQYSVMSYNDGKNGRKFYSPPSGTRPRTPLLYDIAAIQYLYGANTKASLEDNTYNKASFGGGAFLAAIWDAGGNDTIDASDSFSKVKISLQPGSFSSIGGTDDNLAIAYSVTINNITYGIIENATGGYGDDELIGNEFANVLNGGSGRDTMRGGQGDDIYYVDNVEDNVIELANEGTDLVYSSSFSYTLSDNVENLTLIDSGTRGTGNGLVNIITGNDRDNLLNGADGNDFLYGGVGSDKLNGGIDADFLDGGTGSDTASYSTSSAGVTVNLATGQATGGDANGDTLISIEYLEGSEFGDILSGDSQNNSLWGLGGDDILDGGLGADSLLGGLGNDNYYVDDINDIITEYANEGIDSVFSSVTYTLSDNLENLTLTGNSTINGTGNISDNTITGNDSDNFLYGLDGNDILIGGGGSDILDGGLGADSLFGGQGNDNYYVDNISDIITENFNEGNDNVFSSVTYTLSDYLENLTLTGNDAINGTGNTLDNIITGNSSTNTLNGENGNDKLIGGAGADILNGGESNDTASYLTSIAGIIANLTTPQDNTGDASGDVYQSIENLEGSEFSDRLFGDNQNNTLIGLGGDDFLDGYGGDDKLIGGTLSDTYNVDSAGDKVIETIDEGIDTVNASVDYTLAANVENLNLLEGTSALNGTGNELNNIINGNSAKNIIDGGAGDDILFGFALGDTLIGGDGNDWLVGGQGNDILTGGNGDDYFVYNAITDAGDRIYDFTVGSDKLVFTDLLNNLGYHGANAIADGVLGFRQASVNLGIVQIDPDGSAGNLFRATPFILLNDVSVAALSNSNSFVL